MFNFHQNAANDFQLNHSTPRTSCLSTFCASCRTCYQCQSPTKCNSGEQFVLNNFSRVAPGSIPLNLAPRVPHADQRDGFILEVSHQSMTQTHSLHCSHRVCVAFDQPIPHLGLYFMSLCLMEIEIIWCIICKADYLKNREKEATSEEEHNTLMEQLIIPPRS